MTATHTNPSERPDWQQPVRVRVKAVSRPAQDGRRPEAQRSHEGSTRGKGMEGKEQVKPYPKFAVTYKIGDDTYEAIIQAKDFASAQQHVKALSKSAKLDGKLS